MTRSIPTRTTLTVLLAATLALPAGAADGPVAAPADAELAMLHYENCHWQLAFEAFSRLADAGDAQAAQVAAQMARYGERLYGRTFEVGTAQLQRWRLAASRLAPLPR